MRNTMFLFATLAVVTYLVAKAEVCFPPGQDADKFCYDSSGDTIGDSYFVPGVGYVYIDFTGDGATSCPNSTSFTCRDAVTAQLIGYSYADAGGAQQYVDLTGSGATSCPTPTPTATPLPTDSATPIGTLWPTGTPTPLPSSSPTMWPLGSPTPY